MINYYNLKSFIHIYLDFYLKKKNILLLRIINFQYYIIITKNYSQIKNKLSFLI